MDVKIQVRHKKTHAKKLTDRIKTNMTKRIYIAVEEYLDKVKRDTPANVGTLRKSIRVKKVKWQSVEVEFGALAKYAMYVEKGRRKGKFPPLRPIRYWVKRKLGYRGKKLDEVSYLVARKIAQKGTKGYHMFERHFGFLKRRTKQLLRKII